MGIKKAVDEINSSEECGSVHKKRSREKRFRVLLSFCLRDSVSALIGDVHLAPSAPARSGILQSSSTDGFGGLPDVLPDCCNSAGFTGSIQLTAIMLQRKGKVNVFLIKHKNTCHRSPATGIFIMGVMKVQGVRTAGRTRRH